MQRYANKNCTYLVYVCTRVWDFDDSRTITSIRIYEHSTVILLFIGVSEAAFPDEVWLFKNGIIGR